MNLNTSIQPASPMNVPTTPSPSGSDLLARILTIGGRVLVATLFILAGVLKMVGPKPYLEHMAQFGVPTFLLPAVIALELGAGLAILIGWRTREAAAALAIFCVMTAAIFHHQLFLNGERTSFFKDLAIAGGLFLMAAGAAARVRKKELASG
jgi:putative oxidoreductase